MRTGAAAGWTRVYNSRGRLPYQFLAAGHPLPAGCGDAARWFPRIHRAGPARGTVAVHARGTEGRVVGIARSPGTRSPSGRCPERSIGAGCGDGIGAPVRVHAFHRAPEHVLELVVDTHLGWRRGGRAVTGHDTLAAGLPTGEPAG